METFTVCKACMAFCPYLYSVCDAFACSVFDSISELSAVVLILYDRCCSCFEVLCSGLLE